MWVERDLDLIFVNGNVLGTGGNRGAVVFVKDAVKKLIGVCSSTLLYPMPTLTTRQPRGRQKLRGDKSVLPKGLIDLPFPAGTLEMAKHLPSIVATLPTHITGPFVPKDSYLKFPDQP
jgi:large subunit ribosomal protein L3